MMRHGEVPVHPNRPTAADVQARGFDRIGHRCGPRLDGGEFSLMQRTVAPQPKPRY